MGYDSSLCARGVCVHVSNASSSFRLDIDGVPWLTSGDVQVHNSATGWVVGGSAALPLAGHRRGSCADAHGSFQYHALDFQCDQSQPVCSDVTTTVRLYDAGHVAFSTIFPRGGKRLATFPSQNCANSGAMSHCPSAPSTRFPVLDMSNGVFDPAHDAGFLTWHSNMCSPRFGRVAELSNHTFGNEGGPVLLHSRSSARATGGGHRQVAVLSALNQQMTATQNASAGLWVHGVGGELNAVPPGFEQAFLLFVGGREADAAATGVAATGVTATLAGWGGFLAVQAANHTARPPPKMDNETLETLGYWYVAI